VPFCPQCGVDNPAAARYCDQCGAMLIPVTNQAPATPAAPLVNATPQCSQCGTPAIPGEAFCDTCGAPIGAPARPVAPIPAPPSSSGVPQQTNYPAPQPSIPATPGYTPAPPVGKLTAPPASYTPPPPTYTPPVAPAPTAARLTLSPARLVVVASGAILMLPNVAQAVVGRSDPVSKFFPDLDLTPYGALDHGVGRKHVRLFVSAGRVMAEDLDSTNGTKINGQVVPARQPRTLAVGDTIEIGRLAVRYQE
jgi:hypothetical protein